jgi:putative inorganic carbon (HCO3(-)) transporter
MILVSLYATFDITLSFPKIAGLVFGVAVFYAAVAYTRRRQQRGLAHLTGLYLLLGAGMAVVGVFGLRWVGPLAFLNRLQAVLPPALADLPGTVGGVINPNQMAGTMEWVAPPAVALIVGLAAAGWPRRQGRRWLWLLLIPIALLCSGVLVASFSRGGVLGFGLGLLVMLAIPTRWGKGVLLLAVVAGLGLVFYLDLGALINGGGAALEAPLGSDLVAQATAGLGGDFGLDARLEIWSRAIYGLQDFPFTGMSMNGFRRVVHILYPLFLISPATDIAHAHNQLLQTGLDLGLPGLVAYLALWWISAVLLWRSWRGAPDTAHRALVVGVAGALVASWIFGLLDAISLGAKPGFMWWLLLALLVALHDRSRPETAAPPSDSR